MARWWRVATSVRSNLPPSIQSESVQGMGMIEGSLAKFPVCRFTTRLWMSNRLETSRVVQSKVMIAAFHLVNLYFSHIKVVPQATHYRSTPQSPSTSPFPTNENCSSVNNNLSNFFKKPTAKRNTIVMFNFLLILPIVNKLNTIIYFSLITF